MIKVPVPYEITDISTKWGLVTVYNSDRTINRQYKITADEAEAVHHGNNVLPPRCTLAEWQEGRVVVESRPCNPGQGFINPDGVLMLNCGVHEAKDRVNVSLLQIHPEKWTLAGARLFLDSDVVEHIASITSQQRIA